MLMAVCPMTERTTPERTVTDVIADAIGYRRPTKGLIGSGFEQMLAYQRASDIVKALGLPLDLSADVLRRWASDEVGHLGPRAVAGVAETPAEEKP